MIDLAFPVGSSVNVCVCVCVCVCVLTAIFQIPFTEIFGQTMWENSYWQ